MKTVIAIDPGVNTGIVVARVEEEVEILHFDQFICSTHTQTVELIKAYLDQHGLNPRVFMVVSTIDVNDAHGVLRFEADQVNAAVLTKFFCS